MFISTFTCSHSVKRILTLSIILLLTVFYSFPSVFAQDGSPSAQDFKTYEATYGGQTFEVRAAVSNNASISSITVFPDSGSIILNFDEGSILQQSELTIQLPRELIDSKNGSADSEFLVIVDGFEATYNDIQTTDTARLIKFSLPEGTTEIEIFGTQVLPEFPFELPAMAAGVAIVVVIARSLWRRYPVYSDKDMQGV
jgi:hypothetical protein